MFKVNNKDARTTPFWCFCCLIYIYFTFFSSISIVDFEQVNVSREDILSEKFFPLSSPAHTICERVTSVLNRDLLFTICYLRFTFSHIPS